VTTTSCNWSVADWAHTTCGVFAAKASATARPTRFFRFMRTPRSAAIFFRDCFFGRPVWPDATMDDASFLTPDHLPVNRATIRITEINRAD
jgi:hypothetical protein